MPNQDSPDPKDTLIQWEVIVSMSHDPHLTPLPVTSSKEQKQKSLKEQWSESMRIGIVSNLEFKRGPFKNFKSGPVEVTWHPQTDSPLQDLIQKQVRQVAELLKTQDSVPLMANGVQVGQIDRESVYCKDNEVRANLNWHVDPPTNS